MDNVDDKVIRNALHHLYLARIGMIRFVGYAPKDLDQFIADVAKEEMQRTEVMTNDEITREMLADIANAVLKKEQPTK